MMYYYYYYLTKPIQLQQAMSTALINNEWINRLCLIEISYTFVFLSKKPSGSSLFDPENITRLTRINGFICYMKKMQQR